MAKFFLPIGDRINAVPLYCVGTISHSGSQDFSINGWSPGRVMNRFSTIECNWQTFDFCDNAETE